MTSHDLKHALHVAASTPRSAPDPADDLARARAAGRARSRRRVRAGLSGLAAAAVLGVGTTAVLTGQDPAGTPSAGTGSTPSTEVSVGVQLVAESFDATPYTFDLTPEGWAVQGQNEFGVTIAPTDGSVSESPDDFVGKLVIMFEASPPGGRTVDLDGRRFWVTGDSGYTTISTRTLAGEPAGAVRIQYPDDAGWDEETMLAFTASVHVGDGAKHGLG
ncbi:hypothetical protein GCM10023339_42280 [Alloalcanivorax gelatiniphagus]